MIIRVAQGMYWAWRSAFVAQLRQILGEKAIILANSAGAVSDPSLSGITIEMVKKRHFLRHLCIKCIISPRQARDKHRENSKKSGVSHRKAASAGRPPCSTAQMRSRGRGQRR
jgi:hypothetical protein